MRGRVLLVSVLVLVMALQLQPTTAQENDGDVPGTPGSGRLEITGFSRVIDGDTIEVYPSRGRLGIGLIGIDAPSLNTPCGQQASQLLQSLVMGGMILDEDPAFTYDERMRRMYYARTPEGESLARALVQAGVAQADGRGNEAAELAAAQAEAQSAGRGCLWGGESQPVAPSASEAAPQPSARGTADAAPPAVADAAVPGGFVDEVVTAGISQGTGFTTLPDGRVLVTEKAGRVRLYKDGALVSTPFVDIQSRVNSYWDRGLVGIVADPNFATNGYIYLFYSYLLPGEPIEAPTVVRVARYTASGDTASPSTEQIIVGSETTLPCPAGSDCIPSEHGVHMGGNMRFGPDGNLYIVTGDGAHYNPDIGSMRAQDLDSLAGKLLRVSPTGQGLSSNPFWTGDANAARSKIYSYGLRNPYRLNMRPGTATPIAYIGDVGNSQAEEINVSRPGANFGWPCYEGSTQGISIFRNTSTCQDLYGNPSSVRAALYQYPHSGSGASVTGGTFYTGSAYPAEYQGAYFFGDYARNWLKFLRVDADDNLASGPTDFATDAMGPTAIEMGPDQNIWYLSFTYTPGAGQLHRIRYTGGSTPPTATPTATSTPTGGSNETYREAVLADSPVGYWRLGEASGTTAADEGGLLPGTYVGSPTLGQPGALAGDTNTATGFSGSGQYVNVPDASALSPSAGASGRLSLEGWVRLNSLPAAGPATVVSKGSGSGYEYALRVHSDGSAEIVLWAADGTTFQHVSSPTGVITANTWFHLVGTCDNSVGCRIYVNGTQRGEKTTTFGPTPPSDTASPLAIGRRGDNVQYLNGIVDEVSIYNTVLSPARIQAHYAAGTNASGGNTPPTATITSPLPTFRYQNGATISYAGSATDAQDGAIPASSLSWQVVLHHCPGGPNDCHAHPFLTETGAGGSFVDPIHGENSHFEIILTAMDSGGLQHTTAVHIYPDESSYRDAVMADSPIAYWRLGESSGTTAADVVGQHAGSYVGSPTLGQVGALTGETDTAVRFSGSGQHVNVPDSSALSPSAGASGKLTLEAWAHVASLPTGAPGTIVSKGNASGYEYALRIHNDGSAEIVQWAPDGTTYQHVSTATGKVTPGTWHHIVGTCENGVGCRIYLDGTLRGEKTTTFGPMLPGDTSAPLAIGRRSDNVQYLNGTVDEVAIYNSILSVSRIQAHYSAGSGTTPPTPGPTSTPTQTPVVTNTPTVTATPVPTGTSVTTAYRDAVLANNPIAYWRLGEASGTTAADERGQSPGSYVGSPSLGQSGALAGDSNTAVRFSGSGQYVNVPDAGALSPQAGTTGKISLEGWVRLASLPTGGPATVVSKGHAPGYEYALRVHSDGSAEIVLWGGDGTTYQHVSSPSGVVAPNSWYHLVGTCENTVGCKIYVNGTQRGEKSTTWGTVIPSDTSAPLAIGRRSDNIQYLNGIVDEVAVYGTILSAAQVQAHYAAGTATGGSAVPTATTVSVSACDPRPRIEVSTTPGSPGELRVTLRATTNTSTPQNQVVRVAFGAATNATIQIGPQQGTGNFSVDLPLGTQEVQFTVRRTTGGQTTTVPMTVTDGCGSWDTFVGGGPSAF